MFNYRLLLLFYIGFLFALFARPAHAYLDPGTGSYVFQFLIAGLVGAIFVIKSFWRNLSVFLVKPFKKVSNNTAKTKKSKTNDPQT